MESTLGSGLSMRWVAVADNSGRTRVEAVWVAAATAAEETAPSHAA